MSIHPHVLIEGLSKRYGDGPSVLHGLDLEVSAGEFVSLIGPSGCGKSTILKLIAGLNPVTAGRLLVRGQAPEVARDRMAFIFQEPTLLPWLTVIRNIEILLRIRKVPRNRCLKIADGMLALVRLNHVRNHYPRQLSGGMKMRVSIARALSLLPELLLLDEPFGALDEMTRDHLNEELLDLRKDQNWTALFVTHSVREAVFLSNRIVVLAANPGRIHEVVEVPLTYPRTNETRDSNAYLRVVSEVSHVLRSVEGQ
ncbi:MAG: ABC transporter ATP-binding protein [Verrucomicrobia bacterium]|nr:MAG: ABC transporter ATP-binding protein [Verrucomicrobiota bacterium]